MFLEVRRSLEVVQAVEDRETVAMSAIDMDVGVLDWRGRLWLRGLLGEEQPSGKVKTLSLILG